FAIAGILTKSTDLRQIMLSAAVAGLHVIILVLSKDLGGAVIFFVVYFSMLYVATQNPGYCLFGVLSGAAAAVIGYKLFAHVRIRVQAWKDPLGTINDAGYQIAQSLFAIGTGSWFGMGLGQGAPSNIPVVESDFIFSAITEEFGVIFGMCLILICVSCFVMFMNISMRFHNTFYKLVAAGLAIVYGFQVFLTIGGVTKFIPLTGVTLPLVSYGGTSVIVSLIMFAIIQGLYITVRDEAAKKDG
ncbi:MAG TPA: FtsW/RodA/SpoVE family cell cycle protein, partial [Lachnospiraceae bacterium]|nr:FtsW/RodA/SpoVE family cell cycle protein [Lachnospiraceae bacterium]